MILMLAAITDPDDRSLILELYQDHYALVRKVVYGITHDANSVEDLINDAFIKLIANISKLHALNCRKRVSYLVYTAKSVAIDFIIRRDVQNKFAYYGKDADLSERMAEQAATVEQSVMEQEGIEEIYKIILSLPEKQRDVLCFKYILGIDDTEIAQKLNITPSSVRQYLTRARRTARQRMQEAKRDE